MDQEDRKYLGREAAFPHQLQGSWVEDSDPTLVLILNGSEIFWGGGVLDYEDKGVVEFEGGFISVSVEFADQLDGYAIQLEFAGEGEMYAYNDSFASRYVRITT